MDVMRNLRFGGAFARFCNSCYGHGLNCKLQGIIGDADGLVHVKPHSLEFVAVVVVYDSTGFFPSCRLVTKVRDRNGLVRPVV